MSKVKENHSSLAEGTLLAAPDRALYEEDDTVDDEEAGMLQKAVAIWMQVRPCRVRYSVEPVGDVQRPEIGACPAFLQLLHIAGRQPA